MSRLFSQPANLKEEYVIDQIEDSLTLLHIFLFEIPTQFSNNQPQSSLYHHWHFLTQLKSLQDRVEDFLGEDKRLPLLLKAIRREPDFLS